MLTILLELMSDWESSSCTPQLELNSISFFQALWEPFNEAFDLGNCLLTVDN